MMGFSRIRVLSTRSTKVADPQASCLVKFIASSEFIDSPITVMSKVRRWHKLLGCPINRHNLEIQLAVCPLCDWTRRKEDRWSCDCGHEFFLLLRCGELLHLDSGLKNRFITSVPFSSDP